MLKIVYFLLKIQLRKFFGTVDFFVCLIVLFFFVLSNLILLKYVTEYSYYFLLYSLWIFNYHFQRKDLELLKLRKKHKTLLYTEYSIYNLICTIPLLISLQWIPLLMSQLLILVYLYLPNCKTRLFEYPFNLFDPFWVISFRKNKLFLSLIPVLFFIFTGHQYNNENLMLFGLLILAIVLSIPSFQRESIYFIKVSNQKDYFFYQIKINICNSLFLLIPVVVFVIILKEYEMLIFLLVIPLITLLSVSLKYTFFSRPFQQQFLFIFILGGFQYFLPFIAIPILMYYGDRNLKTIKE